MVIDAILGILIIWGFYIGFSKGIIQTVFTLVSYGLGALAVVNFGEPATNFLKDVFNTNEGYMFIAGYILAFFLTMIIVRLIAQSLEGLLKSANINIINQVAGGILFAGLNVLVYSTLLWFGTQSHLVTEDSTKDSKSFVYLEQFPNKVRGVWDTVGPKFKQFMDFSAEEMERWGDRLNTERTESDPVIRDLEDDSATSN